MKPIHSSQAQSAVTPIARWFVCLCAVSSLTAAPLILEVVETGGDNEATDTIVAQWTGQTFVNGIANEPLPNTAADAPFTVGLFQEAAPTFVDRNHRYTHATETVLIPSYLLGAEYIMSGNDNRDNNTYQLDITVSKACVVYMLVDNRMPDDKANTSAPVFGTTRDSNMGWLPLDGFTGVYSGINRDGSLDRPDEIGIDEGADGAGPGLGVNQWYSIYAKQFPAGTLSIYQANNPGRNMYGVVVAPVPDNPRVTASSGNLFGISFQVTDGNLTSLDPASIQLTLDDQPVTPTVSKDGAITTIAYTNPTLLLSLSTHSATLTFLDNGVPANEFSNTLQFTVEYYGTLTADMAVPAGDLNLDEPGFVARVTQGPLNPIWPGVDLPTNIRRAEDHLAGRLRDPATGNPFPNLAFTGDAEPDGTYRIPSAAFPDTSINWNQEAGPGGTATEAGNFTSATTGNPDGAIPGIPGDDLSNLNNISAEIVTYLDLDEGVYRFGVNSDDGFKVTAGKGDPRDPTGLLLGQVDAGRGAANTLFYVNVETAGYYPIRLLYFEGGGGASLEFFSADVATGEFRLINDASDPLAISAYSMPKVKRPYASISPIPNSVGVAANAPIQAQITDQTAIVTPSSIRLELNGATVIPVIAKAGSVTSVLYQPTDFLPPGTNVATLVYADNGSPSLGVTNTWRFVVEDYSQYPAIPAAYAVPAGSVDLNSSGFLVDSYSMAVARSGFADANSYPAAEQQIARGFIDPATTQPFLNLFTAGPVNGRHLISTVNWNEDAPANSGNFTAGNINPDTLIPGQPAAGDSNNIVAEAIGYLDLKRGYYQFGVNSDDGFRVTTAANFRDVSALQLGLFNTGRGVADTLFSFFVEADGIYPVRLLWWEGTGDAACEFFVVEPATGARRLINDRVNTSYFAVNSYATFTGSERPHLKSIIPANGATNQPAQVTLEAVISGLDGGSVTLSINGAAVTPTVTPQGTDTLVTYSPPQPYPSGSTVVAVIEYSGIPATVSFTIEESTTAPPQLAIPTITDGTLTLTWTGGGTLEYTDALGSGWISTDDSDGAYTEPADQPQRFYRVRR